MLPEGHGKTVRSARVWVWLAWSAHAVCASLDGDHRIAHSRAARAHRRVQNMTREVHVVHFERGYLRGYMRVAWLEGYMAKE